MVDEIQGRLEAGEELDEVAAQAGQALRQPPVELLAGVAGLPRGLRDDQIVDRLGLHQIELAVRHRAPGELAGPRRPRAGGDAAFDQ